MIHIEIFDNCSCGLTILRSDNSQYDTSKTLTLTEKKVEEFCPKLTNSTAGPTTTTTTTTTTTNCDKV